MTRPAAHPPVPPADLADALQRVRDHGGRLTVAKRGVAELLFDGTPPLTADAIVERLEVHDRSVIYRCLSQFEDLGIVEHVHLGHGQAVYRRAGLGTVPVLCSACGAVRELDRAQVRSFARDVLDHTGVRLDLTHFPLTGTCHDCVEDATRNRRLGT